MSFTYTQNVPNPPNLPSADVGNMQTNTNSIFSILNVDHETFGSVGSIDGRHKQVSLINEAAPGVPANIGGVLFANNPAPTNISWPFWQNASATVQLIAGAPTNATPGFTYLPGNILMQWGVNNIPSGTGGTVTFPVAFSSAAYSVQLTMDRNSTSSASYGIFLNGAPSSTGFATNSGLSGSHNVYWIAIGPV